MLVGLDACTDFFYLLLPTLKAAYTACGVTVLCMLFDLCFEGVDCSLIISIAFCIVGSGSFCIVKFSLKIAYKSLCLIVQRLVGLRTSPLVVLFECRLGFALPCRNLRAKSSSLKGTECSLTCAGAGIEAILYRCLCAFKLTVKSAVLGIKSNNLLLVRIIAVFSEIWQGNRVKVFLPVLNHLERIVICLEVFLCRCNGCLISSEGLVCRCLVRISSILGISVNSSLGIIVFSLKLSLHGIVGYLIS